MQAPRPQDDNISLPLDGHPYWNGPTDEVIDIPIPESLFPENVNLFLLQNDLTKSFDVLRVHADPDATRRAMVEVYGRNAEVLLVAA